MATIAAQAQAAAITQIEADFYRVFTRWKRMAPWRDAVKGGEGSGHFGHAGRPGQRGGSAAEGTPQHNQARGTDLISTIADVEQLPVIQRALTLEAEFKRIRHGRNVYKDELSQNANDRNDPYLAAVLKQQGFDGLPEAVSEDAYQSLIASGEIVPLFRGIEGDNAAHYVEQYRSGPLFVGAGIYGNGTYATTDRDRALGYTDRPEGLAELGLRADAKITDVRTIDMAVKEWKDKARVTYRDSDEDDPHRFVVGYFLDDPGRVATALGYDALKHGSTYVILNRTATVVKKGGAK